MYLFYCSCSLLPLNVVHATHNTSNISDQGPLDGARGINYETRYATGSCEVAMVTSCSQTIRRRLGSVTLTGQGLGLGLGTSLFPISAMEIKAWLAEPVRLVKLQIRQYGINGRFAKFNARQIFPLYGIE